MGMVRPYTIHDDALSGRSQQPVGLRPALIVLAVAVLALLNPLLCVLHCEFAPHMAGGAAHLHEVGFFCDLPEAHPTATDASAPASAPAPRAVYELVATLVLPVLLVALLLSSMSQLACLRPPRLAEPPSLPPPRLAP